VRKKSTVLSRFALETEKLRMPRLKFRKKLRLIVLNSLQDEGAGFKTANK
jgi:hypothetical protein